MHRLTPIVIALLAGMALWTSTAVAQNETIARGGFFGANCTVYPAWFKESFLELADDVAEAAANGKRIMLIFHQDGCPYCNRLIEVNLAQRDIEQYLRRNFDVVALNMWGDREVVSVGGETYTEKAFAQALAVQFTPTIVFFDEQGKIILRLNGYQPPAQFKLALRFVAERQETSTDYRTFVCLHAPPETGGALNSQPFFMAPPYDLRRGPGARPLAVFFEQIECPNCDRLHQQVLSDPEIRQMLGGFDVVQLDIWSTTPLQTPDARISTARDWARELHISYAPSIVLFSPVGEEVIRSEAWFKTFHAGSVLDYVLSGSYHSEPSFQRFISARANHFREQGIDVDI